MLTLNAASIQNEPERWEAAGVRLPSFDRAAMKTFTKTSPAWLHFGAGNIFRGFIAALQQRLLDRGLSRSGIVAAETFDFGILDAVYRPFDDLTLMVTLHADGATSREIIASVAEAVRADASVPEDLARLREVAENPSLQLISFTITEKGYALYGSDGALLPGAAQDAAQGPDHVRHAMGVTASLLYRRWQAGGFPVAVVSMDNCSRNGEKLRSAVLAMANLWQKNGLVEEAFCSWLEDENRVSFPWSMIDKITPRPDPTVMESLQEAGIGGMEPVITERGTYIAPFVNGEEAQYLVIEDRFPNGRPPLEEAGVYLTDRETVEKSERMKVTACLNPLHTSMSLYGCLLGHTRICEEMRDPEITALIRRLGYCEGLPVVADPIILRPKDFLDEVIEKRLPNPFLPDTPQRIATDTSQKIPIRFGETIKSYCERGLDMEHLTAVCLTVAGWLRYLLAVDDEGKPFSPSSDPRLSELQDKLHEIRFGDPQSVCGRLSPILSDESLFGLNLCETPLAARIEGMLMEELAGPGAVRAALRKYLTADPA